MKKKRLSIRKIAALLVASSFVAVALAQFFYARMTAGGRATDEMYARLGQLGDFYGGIINPVVGIITIVLLLFTIWMQNDEMRSAREDADRSKKHDEDMLAIAKNEAAAADMARRHAADEALAAIERERKALVQERFEQAFYASLPIYLSHIENFEHRNGNSTLRGRQAIQRHHDKGMDRAKLNDAIKAVLSEEQYDDYINLRPFDQQKLKQVTSIIQQQWFNTMVEHGEQYSLIFRVLLHLLQWIDSQDDDIVPFANKRNLVQFINSHMSDSEFWSIFFHVMCGTGAELRPYMEKYSFFEPHWFPLRFPSFLNYPGRHLLRHSGKYFDAKAAFGKNKIDTDN